MATDLGQAYVQIVPSAKGISGSIQNALDPEASAAGTSAGLKIGTGLKVAAMAAVAAAGAALGKVISSSLTEGANLQQSLGGIETLFKGSADKVKKYADEAYRTSGLSANEYMTNVTSFSASLLQSVGGDTEKAADVANMAMIDMSDNANKMGTNMGDIQNAYQGFAKQNYTMLDNLKLGYGGTKEEMQRLLADAEKLTGVKYDINNLSDVYNAIHAIQENLDITGTTAKEASETFTGSFNAMKASLKNVLGKMSLGQDIKPSLNQLAETTSTFFFGNFLPMVGNILKALPGAFVTFVKAAIPYIKDGVGNMLKSAIEPLGDIGKKVTESIKGFGDIGKMFDGAFSGLGSKIDIPAMALKVFQGALTALVGPAGLVIKAVGLIAQAFQNEGIKGGISQLTTSFDELVTGISQNAPQLGASFGTALSGIMTAIANALPGIISGGIKITAGLISGIAQGLPQLTIAVGQLISAFTNTIVTLLPMIITSATTIITTFLGALSIALPQIISAGGNLINSILQGINQQLPMLIQNVSTIVLTWLTAFNEQLPQILQAGMNLLITFLQGIANNIGQVTQQALNIIIGFTSVIAQNMPAIVNSAVDLMVNFANSLAARMPDIVAAAANLIANFINGIANNLGKIIDSAVNLITSFLRGIANRIPDIVSAAMDLVDAMVRGLVQAQGRLMDAAINLVNGFAENIRGRQQEVRNAAWNLLDAIRGVFIPDSLVDVGRNLISGLLSGIQDMAQTVYNKVSEIASNVKNTLTGLFDIHSPSRWMRDMIGKNMMLGWEDGLESNAKKPTDALKNTVNSMQDVLDKGLDISSINDIPFDPQLESATDSINAQNYAAKRMMSQTGYTSAVSQNPSENDTQPIELVLKVGDEIMARIFTSLTEWQGREIDIQGQF
ncbi:phage tail protein [Enterococcus avium]|jgi:phage-related protein|uniref:Phage tail protein n=1 Tax=Enterococcus avium TaxID=33945 RepID=A0A437ULU6_ENTAV|nr:hypothetical protein [Enterococcus avium]RVU94565.1 hypothetical protein EK398_06740 [Enterococcus avium]DAY97315.1 MAG TPA: tail tape measure protein [Caudoviricetes sp.]